MPVKHYVDKYFPQIDFLKLSTSSLCYQELSDLLQVSGEMLASDWSTAYILASDWLQGMARPSDRANWPLCFRIVRRTSSGRREAGVTSWPGRTESLSNVLNVEAEKINNFISHQPKNIDNIFSKKSSFIRRYHLNFYNFVQPLFLLLGLDRRTQRLFEQRSL